MQLLLLVLNQVEKLEDLLMGFMDEGITGATIINSTGMIKELAGHMEDQPIFGSQWFNIDTDRKESKTIFMALSEKQVEKARKVIHQVIGDLSEPDTAVLFTIPLISSEGIDE
ncbi:MAG: hypothetical protein GX213_10500 [Clostridiaceae bacterium]|nr:hypothetical protein [Clostridiaceae bacterium]